MCLGDFSHEALSCCERNSAALSLSFVLSTVRMGIARLSQVFISQVCPARSIVRSCTLAAFSEWPCICTYAVKFGPAHLLLLAALTPLPLHTVPLLVMMVTVSSL